MGRLCLSRLSGAFFTSAAVPMTKIARASNLTTYMCQINIVASTTNIIMPTMPQTRRMVNHSVQVMLLSIL